MKFKKCRYNAFDLCNAIVMIFLVFVCVYPFWYVTIGSFSEGTDYLRGGVYLWPRVFSLDNFTLIFNDNRLVIGFRNTIMRTVIGTIIGTL
jgi:putative aldouronate transport system permease protein